jgi:PQQ-dependent catabolism-associated CXXCW motif protein
MSAAKACLLSALIAFAVGSTAHTQDVESVSKIPDEPADYRLDNYRAPVPLTLHGALVVDTPALVQRLADSRTIVIDVLPQELRPPRLAPDNVWLPPPHDGIPGAIWLPNVGYGQLPPSLLAYFADGLRQITGNDPDRPLVFYCRSDCWMSWNAARRALCLGYRQVFWYRDGIEGWRKESHPVTVLTPFGTGSPAIP